MKRAQDPEAVELPGAVQLPVACSLGRDDGAARLRRWEALSAKGRLSVRRSDLHLEVHYRPEPGLYAELRALAAAERECCSFAEWKVTRAGGDVILHVASDPARSDDFAAIAALFRVP